MPVRDARIRRLNCRSSASIRPQRPACARRPGRAGASGGAGSRERRFPPRAASCGSSTRDEHGSAVEQLHACRPGHGGTPTTVATRTRPCRGSTGLAPARPGARWTGDARRDPSNRRVYHRDPCASSWPPRLLAAPICSRLRGIPSTSGRSTLTRPCAPARRPPTTCGGWRVDEGRDRRGSVTRRRDRARRRHDRGRSTATILGKPRDDADAAAHAAAAGRGARTRC